MATVNSTSGGKDAVKKDGRVDTVTETALPVTKAYTEELLDRIPTYLCVADPATGKIIYSNEAARRDLSDEIRSDALCGRLLEKAGQECAAEKSFSLELGSGRHLCVSVSRILWHNGREALLACAQDISDKRRHEEYLREAFYIDRLTGLPNRYRCSVDLAAMVETAKSAGETGYVIFLDMDDFKIINDGYGHDYGDDLLKEFARFLDESKLPGDKVFRFGGDEFAILIHPSNADEINAVVKGMLERARKPWDILGKSFYCTISVGVVAFPDGDMDSGDIMKNADVAMYEAKSYGKNSFAFYTSGMRNDSIERAEMERMLRESISDDFCGFTVQYQPMVRLEDDDVIAAEALIRWYSPDGDSIPPDNFISLAEYLGLIVDLGEFILRRAAELLREINTKKPDFKLSVNISLRQFQQQDFLGKIEAIINDTGVNPHNLILEITEGLAVTDMRRIQAICGELHKNGVKIAMDDFGTGYSSLSNMRDVPFDIIKIDRAFIQKVDMDSYSASFIRLITDFGHSVSKSVCIEGVETQEQLTYCREAGADSVQGFFCHRPLGEKDLLNLIAR